MKNQQTCLIKTLLYMQYRGNICSRSQCAWELEENIKKTQDSPRHISQTHIPWILKGWTYYTEKHSLFAYSYFIG